MPVISSVTTAVTESSEAKSNENVGDDVENASAIDIATQDSGDAGPSKEKRRINWSRLVVFGLLPALALLLTIAAAFAKWQDSSVGASELARIESVQTAKDATTALLSYQPDSAEHDLLAARERLTGSFKDDYTKLIQDVVIPGAKQQRISAAVNVPEAASVSATSDHAVVLVFVNQTTTMGTTAPSDMQSSVRVTMDKIGDHWLVSGFDPV